MNDTGRKDMDLMNGTKTTGGRLELQGERKAVAAADWSRQRGSREDAFAALEDHGPHDAASFGRLRDAEWRLARSSRPATERMRWCEASLRRLRRDAATGHAGRSWPLAERVMAVSDGLPWGLRRAVGVQLLALGHAGDVSDAAVRDRSFLLFAYATFTDRAGLAGEGRPAGEEGHCPSLSYGLGLIRRFAAAGRPLAEVRRVLESMWSTALMLDQRVPYEDVGWPDGRTWFVPVAEAWATLATQQGVAADRGAAWLVSRLERMDADLNECGGCFAALRTLGHARLAAMERMLEGGRIDLARRIHFGHEWLAHKGLKRELKPLRTKTCRMMRQCG